MHAQPMDGRTQQIMRSGSLVSLATAGAIVLAACGGPTGTPSISIGQVITLSPSPTFSASGLATLPAVPAGFPLMAGMQPDEPLPAEPGLIGRWTTSANGADVFAFLQSELPKAGYRIDLAAPGDTVAVIRFTPPGGRQLQIDLAQQGAGTALELRLPRD